MSRRDETSDQISGGVSEDTICVAVGKDMKEGKSVLVWAIHNSGGKGICLLHVHQPQKLIPNPLGPLGMPEKFVNEILVRQCKESGRLNMHENLDKYDRICTDMGVPAQRLQTEMQSIEEGIVGLITQHGIKKLVMGAAAEKHYDRKMMDLRSRKAKYVCERAPRFCNIQFICKGFLIKARYLSVAQRNNWDDGGSSNSNTILTKGTQESSSPESRSGEQDALSWSPQGSVCSQSSPREVLDLTLRTLLQPSAAFNGFVNINGDISSDNTFYETLQKAMGVAEKVARDLGEAMGKAQEELLQRKEMAEAQAKEKEELEKVKNELRNLREQETSLKEEIKELKQEFEVLQNKHMYQFSEFSLSEIKAATQYFNESLKIGEGGYGNIYKGFFGQTEVAIKILHSQRLHSHCGQGPSEFQTEVRVLSQLKHPNLVRLIGSCPEAFALIYEYLPNGNLEERLKCRNSSPPLSWQTRIRLATDLCSVLVYLHSSKPHSIVHGDLKPSNILLDANFVCKLSDFGICRVLCHEQISNNNTTLCRITVPKGTMAYVDPEFLETGNLTTKADVYSFGIILLELLIKKPAFSVVKDVKDALGASNLNPLLDPLAGGWPTVLAQTLAELALRCCDRNRKMRPNIESEVLEVLQSMSESCGA